MSSIQDWTVKAARQIKDELEIDMRSDSVDDGYRVTSDFEVITSTERIAAIIVTFAEPILKLLAEARREHDHSENGDCCSLCSCNDVKLDFHCHLVPNTSERSCTCGADDLNKRIDEALR